MNSGYKQFITEFPRTEANKPLAPFTTLKVGGPADLYYALTDIEELPKILTKAKGLNIPYFILGGGSNTIFHDKGFRGIIIHIKADNIRAENNRIIADAGVLLSKIIHTARQNNLSGIEKLTGIPGTIGGAVRGNAGAFGTEIKDIFEKAVIYNEEKGLHEEPASYFDFAYRSSTVKAKEGKDIVLQVYLKFEKKSPEEIEEAKKETAKILKSRVDKQPAGKTIGSFFKNPDPDKPAGKLLDEAGCKSLKVGDIQVSDKHANWIMNTGNATQKDVLKLMEMMQERVKERFNIQLEPEVQFINETGLLK